MKIFFFLLSILPLISYSQIIDNSKSFVFNDDPFFNTAFIKNNKIKSIHGVISTKKELSAIKKTNLVVHFDFDVNGDLIKQYSSIKRHNKTDTTFTMYTYSQMGNLITKRTNDAHGFYSYNYEYDASNRLIRKTYCRDENANKNRNDFKLGKQYTIINESYSYTKQKNKLLKNIFNNNGRIYEKHESVYDTLGYLKKLSKRLLINNKKSWTEYEYNEKGLLKSVANFKSDLDSPVSKFTYRYDEHGNLAYVDEYKNGVHVTHKELLYESATFLLKTILIQDVSTNFIKIIKFNTILR